MPFRVKVDENLPNSMAVLLVQNGYSTASVSDQGWGGMKDEELGPKVFAEGRFLVTADKGFGDIRRYPPGTHSGVLLLRLDKPSVRGFLRLMSRVLSSTPLEALHGSVAVATFGGLRIHRPVP